MKRTPGQVTLQPAKTGIFDHLIADLVFDTDPSVFGCLVRNDRELFSRWITPLWQSAECSYSHDCATIALEDGELLGFEQGYSGGLRPFLENQSGKGAAGLFSGDLLAHVMTCSQHLNYVVPFVPKSAYYVHLLSIREENRGQGLGRKLLENAFKQAAESGFKSVHLDVYEGNPAIGFYENMGMEKWLETRFPAMQALWEIPPHFRMVKTL
ncbi:MAG: GNAT family N-acetyltransferase [Deltaproteobacteria bacterium]|nr:GNAT family N-acetyltransferase [Deltaproteobacteria bacterium]MBT4265431.1 GNAT family N-acetyltransferase [Deltaproteobacteria bacterium]MBT6613400.1 GNAT family N-acetyltransferase [Deltaproteobacteria bacterium]